jgi:hypothetical protein
VGSTLIKVFNLKLQTFTLKALAFDVSIRNPPGREDFLGLTFKKLCNQPGWNAGKNIPWEFMDC